MMEDRDLVDVEAHRMMDYLTTQVRLQTTYLFSEQLAKMNAPLFARIAELEEEIERLKQDS